MATEIDSLQIEIQAKATKANDAIDRLSDKLERLEIALDRIGKVNISGFVNSINDLSKSVTSVKTTGFSRLAENINKLSNLDTSKLNHIPEALNQMVISLNKVAAVSDNAQNIGLLALNISKLGNKTATNAIANIPQLTKGLESLIVTLSKAPQVNQSVIDMTNALAKLSSQGSKVGSSSKAIVSGLNRTNTAMSRTTKQATSLASAFGKFYASYFMIIRGVKGLWDAVESSMDYVETYNYFNVALGKIGEEFGNQFTQFGYDSAESYVDSFGERLNDLNKKMTGYMVGDSGELILAGDMGLGLNIEQMMNFQAKVLSVTNSVGLMGEASVSTAKAVSMLAGDLSSLTNVDVESVMESLTSGLIGQSRALYKYGIDITNNTLQQYAYAEGIDKAISEMTQSEKMQLRLLAILDQSEVAWGDLGNTVDSVANQYRVFQQQIKNLGRTFGSLFLPIVQNVLPYVNGLVIALNNLFTSLGFSMYGDTWLSDLQDGISGSVQGDVGELEDGLEDADDAAKKLKKSLSSFDELDVISISGVSSAADAEGVIDLTASIADALTDYEKQWNKAFENAENRANEFAEIFAIAFRFDKIEENFSRLVGSVTDFSEAIKPFTTGFGDGFLTFFETLADVSLELFTTSLGNFTDELGELSPEALEAIGNGLGILAGSLITITATSKIVSGLSALSTGLGTLGGVLKANPILSTFTLATGLLTLIELAEKNAEIKIAIDMADIIKDISELEKAGKEMDTALSNVKRSLIEIDQQPLANAYTKWKELNSKVGELTDEEKGKLREYANVIEKYFPEARKYIDDNGKAYAGMANELERAVKEAVLLAQVQGVENILAESTEIELKAQINLESAKDTLDEIVEYFKELFPELTEVEIRGMLDDYYKTYQASGGKKGNLFVPGTHKSPIEVAKDRNPNRKGKWDWLTGDITHYNKLQELEEAAEKYAKVLPDLQEKEKDLEEAQKVLNLVQKKSIEINSEYAVATATSEEKTKALKTAVSLLSTETEVVTDKMGLLGKALEGLKTGVLEKLNEEMDALSEKEVTIPVNLKVNGKAGNGFHFVLPAYSVGGFPEDGLFMANHGELVGKFSNGKTAVANNEQIVSGIKQGVYEAVVSAMGTRNSESGDIIINMDGKEVFKVVRKRANEYFDTNGKSAFNY